jgi:hypothetical protein
MRTKPSEARLRTILSRQATPRWGADYQPAIQATVREAPSISRATLLRSKRLGRDIHTLSSSERRAALLALYHPRLFDLHEQRMLSGEPAPHPLSDHPLARGLALPPLRGTVDVAERLGYLPLHPTISVASRDREGRFRVPFPYIGDFLLYLRDDDGAPYCVNWSVKQSPGEFLSPSLGRRRSRNPDALRRTAAARHEIESAYYADAGIRTEAIAGSSIDPHVAANLNQLFLWHGIEIDLPPDPHQDMVGAYRALMVAGIAPIEQLQYFMHRFGVSRHTCLAVFHRAIWDRQIMVDLFRPLLFDRPMRPSVKDVIDHHASWFAR